MYKVINSSGIPRTADCIADGNRYRAWGADLIPIIAGIAGGGAGSIFGVPAAGGILGGIGGDYLKEYVKARIPTDKEEEVRKYYQEVKR